MTDLTNLTVAQIRDGHRAGDFSAVEVAEAFNANVAGAKALNAFIVETPEPLPVHQVRRQPSTEYAWQKYPQGWRCALLSKRLSDDDVRSWPVMEEVA